MSHCLDGESLLLAKRIVEALREHGDTVHIITKTHAAVQNVGLGAQTADHGMCGTATAAPPGWSSKN